MRESMLGSSSSVFPKEVEKGRELVLGVLLLLLLLPLLFPSMLTSPAAAALPIRWVESKEGVGSSKGFDIKWEE